MRKIILLILFSVGQSVCSDGYCQVTSYSFTAYGGTYTDLTSGTVAPLTQDPISTYPGDDGYSNGLPIGFTFRYDGINYTTISLSTNGWAAFGQINSSAAITNNLFSGGTRPLVAPLWDDIGIASVNDLTYQTSGSAPNRVMTIQWNNVKWSYIASNTPCIAFQLKLYETLNRIEFVYKQLASIISTAGASIGITGGGTGGGNFLSLNSSGPSPIVSSTVETSNINTRPATGQVYQFNPPPPCSNTATLPFQEGFNSSTSALFTCWSKVVVLPGGTAPDLTVVGSGSSPVSAPNESTGMLKFNANSATTGTRIRAIPPTFNTTGVTSVDVSFSMFENNSTLPSVSNNDFVILQYSINGGATWKNADTNHRYNQNLPTNASGNRWYKRYFTLPAEAGNRTDLRIALLFVSAAGNDIYIDDFTVRASVPIATSGNCTDVITETNVCGQNRFRIVGSNGGPVVEIRPSNNNLGTATIKYFVHAGPVRKDNQNIYYMDRNYEIRTASQPSSPVPVKFYFTTAELGALQGVNSFANLSNLMATRVSGSPGDQCSPAFMNTNANTKVLPTSDYGDYSNGHYVILRPAGFSQFFIYEDPPNRVLPPSEIVFSAREADGANLLEWLAIIESGIHGYYIERSQDGMQWKGLGTIISENRPGAKYIFIDHSPSVGNNYYRLIQRAISGRERYSIIRMVRNATFDLVISPSPATNKTTLTFNSTVNGVAKLQIIDVAGRVVRDVNIMMVRGNNRQEMEISHLSSGVYMLTLNVGTKSICKKFRKT